jgi:tellurite resistance protein TehA-like permease
VGFFTIVMATGIVALALREEGAGDASWILAAVAAAVYLALIAVLLVRRPGRPASRGPALELFAFVAASEVLSSLSTWHPVSVVLWAIGVAAWLAIVPLVLSTPRGETDAVRGSWLLTVVATNSLAVAAAPIAERSNDRLLLGFACAWWLLALTLYCVLMWQIVGRARRRELGIDDLHGDHWVAMGALAISTLAGMRVLAGINAFDWAPAAHDIARTLGIAAWIGALCWLPVLVASESWRLRRRPLYTHARWSSVFPLGMLAVASHALALTAGIAAGGVVSDVFTPIAVVAWLATAAGLLATLTRTPARAPDRPRAP